MATIEARLTSWKQSSQHHGGNIPTRSVPFDVCTFWRRVGRMPTRCVRYLRKCVLKNRPTMNCGPTRPYHTHEPKEHKHGDEKSDGQKSIGCNTGQS